MEVLNVECSNVGAILAVRLRTSDGQKRFDRSTIKLKTSKRTSLDDFGVSPNQGFLLDSRTAR